MYTVMADDKISRFMSPIIDSIVDEIKKKKNKEKEKKKITK